MSYGGYPPGAMYGQQQLNYPANYYGSMNPYGYHPSSYMNGYYGGGYGNYGGYGYGGYGGYGSYGGSMYLPYKPSTLRSIFNRIRHGSNYNYYPGYGYEYGRHRGSWIE